MSEGWHEDLVEDVELERKDAYPTLSDMTIQVNCVYKRGKGYIERTIDDGKIIVLSPDSNTVNKKIPLVPGYLSRGVS